MRINRLTEQKPGNPSRDPGFFVFPESKDSPGLFKL